jgi:hypothetical protein
MWAKKLEGRWHLPLTSFMFSETVNKNKPGKLCFKVIENTFLTNPNLLYYCQAQLQLAISVEIELS